MINLKQTAYRNVYALAVGLALVAACVTPAPRATDFTTQEPATLKRQFVDGRYGQVHVRIASPAQTETDNAPLVLLHPSPYSSAFFLDFMSEMSSDRWVIAIDTPGFGDSARPAQPPSIAEYADNALVVLSALGLEQEVDLLGYHTGTLIAVEMALQSPDRVRRLVLPGVPHFTGQAQADALAQYAKPDTLDPTGSHHDSKWAFASGGIKYGMTLSRAQEHFADMVQAIPESGHAYYGVFSYPGEDRFPQLSHPSLFIATTGSLLEETKAAQAISPNSELVVMTEYPHNVFDLGVPHMANLTRRFLDQ